MRPNDWRGAHHQKGTPCNDHPQPKALLKLESPGGAQFQSIRRWVDVFDEIALCSRSAAIRDGVRRAETLFQAKEFKRRGNFFNGRKKELSLLTPAMAPFKKPKTKGFLEWSCEEILQYEQRWPIGIRERVCRMCFSIPDSTFATGR